MTEPSAKTVLGDFSERTIPLPEGTVRLSGDWSMELNGERHKVDLVLASGRQHQLYITRGSDGGLSLLPIIWSSWTKEWLPTSLYQPGWASLDVTRGCLSCHLSQAYRRVDPTQTAWVDLSVNCESCHGPGAEHIRRRRTGRTDEIFRSLKGLGKEEDARVCGQCHGFAIKPYVFPRADDGLPQTFVTSLVNGGLRPDGTQHTTSYQYPGHVLSQCFQKGALTCSGCHQPHALTPRDFTGASAAGVESNRQCTVCHRDKTPAHSHHSPKIRCVDCHMSYSWIDEDERRKQRTSDHSISIPRPEESLRLGTPNACTTCHHDRTLEWASAALRSWGVKSGVREWVETIALARKQTPGIVSALVRLLDSASPYLQASALDLLLLQPPEPQLLPLITPFSVSEDPSLRAPAIRLLMSYDAQKWSQVGLADAHPYVRMETFSFIKDMTLLSPAAIDRDLADTLAYKNPPTDGLVHLITVRHRRHEIKEALALVDLLQRYALPRERARLDLDAVRARLR